MLLKIEQLDVFYGRNHAVKGMSLELEEGEIVAVLGANGAGKTSLLKAIQGAVPAAHGRVLFKDADLGRSSAARRVRMGLAMVPEGRQIFVSMSVHDNLLLGAHTRRDDSARDIEAIYERFPNLAQRRHMPASVLSGGEQQMLAIGRALLSRPAVMMLDEPSLGLSPLLVDQLFQLIVDLNRSGLAILLVEQNTNMALSVAVRGYVLELGRTVMQGTPEELSSNEQLAAAYLGTS